MSCAWSRTCRGQPSKAARRPRWGSTWSEGRTASSADTLGSTKFSSWSSRHGAEAERTGILAIGVVGRTTSRCYIRSAQDMIGRTIGHGRRKEGRLHLEYQHVISHAMVFARTICVSVRLPEGAKADEHIRPNDAHKASGAGHDSMISSACAERQITGKFSSNFILRNKVYSVLLWPNVFIHIILTIGYTLSAFCMHVYAIIRSFWTSWCHRGLGSRLVWRRTNTRSRRWRTHQLPRTWATLRGSFGRAIKASASTQWTLQATYTRRLFAFSIR